MTDGLMIDTIGSNADALMAALGPNHPGADVILAAYATGTEGIDWTTAQRARVHALGYGLFVYDQTPGLALFAAGGADAGDIERGAGLVGPFIDACRRREARGWTSWGYISQAGYAALAAEVASAGLHHVQYGIANWNDSLAAAQAQLGGLVVYVQWASPGTNPGTIVPGTNKTCAELNCDLNATIPAWFAPAAPPPPPAPTPAPPAAARGLLITEPLTGDLTGRLVTSTDGGHTWKIS
jgi:hypothetical protein